MKLRGGEIGSMSKTSSKNTRKPESGVLDPFPAGLRVLVVDDDPTCLIILEKMLRTCNYVVTKTNTAEVALTWLRENHNGFDIVISDVHMPDMDGFKLLEHVGLEMDLPVIMMSADDSNNVVMKGVTHGACDYLIKPVRIEELKNIWQHVVRKKKNEWKAVEQSSSWDDGGHKQKQDDVVSSPGNEGSWKSSKRKNEDEDPEEKDDSTTPKKQRVVWSVELHQKFVSAVNQLGIDKAVPKKILEMMNVPGLTRENVASHLQKYRLYLKRLSEHRGGLDNPFMSHDSGFSAMSSFSSLDLQAAQLSSHPLSAYSSLPALNPSMSIPFVNQTNVFSFQNANRRYGDTHLQQLSNASKPMNLLHGIPTTMEPKQFAGLNQSVQNVGNMNMQANASTSHHSSSLMKMAPQPSRGQVLNETVGGRGSRIQPSVGQPMQSNGAARPILSKNGLSYNPVSQAGPMINYPINQIPNLPGDGSLLGSTPEFTYMSSKGFNQEENSSNSKTVDGYVGSYDVVPEMHPHKSQYWQPQNPNTSFGTSSQHARSAQDSVHVVPSVSGHQYYNSNHKTDQNGNILTGKPVFSDGLDNQHVGMQNVNQNVNSVPDDHTSIGKTQRTSGVVNHGTNHFSEHRGQDDLMCALLKQVRNRS